DVVAAAARGARRVGYGRGPAPGTNRPEGGVGRRRLRTHRNLRRTARRRTAHRHAGPFFADDRHQAPQVADDFLVDPLAHGLEEREALLLVLDERIPLAVAAKADAFFQMIEAVEVILPLRVDDLQHDVALDAVEDGRIAEQRLLLL